MSEAHRTSLTSFCDALFADMCECIVEAALAEAVVEVNMVWRLRQALAPPPPTPETNVVPFKLRLH